MENSKKVHVLTVRCTNEIKQHEIALFRGAVNAALGHDANVLFHNHQNDNFRYSYPLIQYKRIGGKAAIVCVNEGVDALLSKIFRLNTTCQLGERKIELEIAGIEPITEEIVSGQYVKYRLRKWLPLNSGNYVTFNSTRSLRERVIILERILKGNILSFAKGVGVCFDYDVKAEITDIISQHYVINKGTRLIAFDVSFVTNVNIPNNVGLGKNVSIGYGVVDKIGQCEGMQETSFVETEKEIKGLEPEQKTDEPIFLLGGNDLEMTTIKNILQNHGCTVYDKNLTWQTAKLSAYADVISEHPQSLFYGIELASDVEEPKRYIPIDHHNSNRQGPSAIEQVAEVLGAKMSRFHLLVAANDKGYIPGMKKIEATEEEVFYIRYLDRRAQGVTEDEEEMAEVDVEKAEMVGKLTVVTTGVKHFSPIVDRMYPYIRLLILADKELTYYGEGIDRLRNELMPICNELYYGGYGDTGYLGIPESSTDVFEEVKQKIIELARC